MTTRADAVDDGGLLLPLRQIEREEQERVRQLVESLDAEFKREFGRQGNSPVETGPEPWAGFLDLSQL